ncbi:MAG: hypothetical protein NVS1B13_20930 [Flavisolibacter sp.]
MKLTPELLLSLGFKYSGVDESNRELFNLKREYDPKQGWYLHDIQIALVLNEGVDDFFSMIYLLVNVSQVNIPHIRFPIAHHINTLERFNDIYSAISLHKPLEVGREILTEKYPWTE